LALALTLPPETAVEVGVDLSALASESPRELQALIREASEIWRPAGVTLVWALSPSARAFPHARVVLDVVRDDGGTGAGARTVRLGAVTFLDGQGSVERSLALSVKAVRGVVDEAPWANRRVADWPPAAREELVGRALGRVLAHEIGHYLLAWRGHTSDGLMCAEFRAERLVDPDRLFYQVPRHFLPRLYGRLALLGANGRLVTATR
jgi:hypothetical protein